MAGAGWRSTPRGRAAAESPRSRCRASSTSSLQHAIGEPRGRNACCSELVLLARQRDRGDSAAARPRGVDRHPAPATTDLEQVIARRQLEQLAQPIELRGLRVGERTAVAPDRARIRERLGIEEQSIEAISEIVVSVNVALTAAPRTRAPAVNATFTLTTIPEIGLSIVPRSRERLRIFVRDLARLAVRSPTRKPRSSIGCASYSNRPPRDSPAPDRLAAGPGWRSTPRGRAAAGSPRSRLLARAARARAARVAAAGLADRVTVKVSRLPRSRRRVRQDRLDRDARSRRLRVSPELLRDLRALLFCGRVAVQTITTPDDRFDAYRRSVDWMQTYIFPAR